MYQQIIREIDPTVDARGVEASMRLEYGTLDHLSRDDFRREIAIAKAMEAEAPGSLASLAGSMGIRNNA